MIETAYFCKRLCEMKIVQEFNSEEIMDNTVHSNSMTITNIKQLIGVFMIKKSHWSSKSI